MVLVVSLWGCGGEPLTVREFSDELWKLQCAMDTCHRPDDGCSVAYVQPTLDCTFDPKLGEACLEAVRSRMEETPEMWAEDEEGELAWCACGNTEWGWELDYQGEQCRNMPDPNALPSECGTVCADD